MKRLGLAFLVFILAFVGCTKVEEIEGPEIFEGTIEEISIPATDPNVGTRGALVYLPHGYYDDTTARYPVVYLLHGYGGTFQFWQAVEDIKEIADYMISVGELPPSIIVLPDGYNALGGSFYTNSTYGGQSVFGLYEDYIIEDVIGYIDSHYRTDTTKRAIDGISMGGYGALKLAFKHPELFKAAASHSGPVSFEMFFVADTTTGYTMIDYVLFENPVIDTATGDTIGYHIPYPPVLGEERPLTTMLFAMAGAFSPKVAPFSDFDIPNYEFPLDSIPGTGLWAGVVLPFTDDSVKTDVLMQWLQEDVTNLAVMNKDAILDAGLNIYFDCGTEDEYMLQYHAMDLAEKLSQNGIPYTFELFDGTLYPGAPGYPSYFPAGHGNLLYLRIRESLKFIGQVFTEE